MSADSEGLKGFVVFENLLFLLIIPELVGLTLLGQTKAPICPVSYCLFPVSLNRSHWQHGLMREVLQEKIDLSL